MIKNFRTAVKFFVYGLVLGLLFAPRSGAETRDELLGWLTGSVKEAVNNATGSSSTS
jgi:gas vesicle protein